MKHTDPWNTRYTTAEICEMYGLSASGLRFLEDQGLITPQRNTYNRYRIFTLTECMRLFSSRILRQYGFSMPQSISATLHTTIPEHLSQLDEHEAALEAEIRHKQQLLASLRKRRALIERIQDERPCCLVRSPDMLRLTLVSKTNSSACANAEDFQHWYAQLPFTAASLLIDQSTLEADEIVHDLGFIIEMDAAAQYGIAPSAHTASLPAACCLYTCLDFAEDLHDLPASLAPTMQTISQMNLEIAGDPFTRMLGGIDLGSGMRRMDEAWFPVKRKA